MYALKFKDFYFKNLSKRFILCLALIVLPFFLAIIDRFIINGRNISENEKSESQIVIADSLMPFEKNIPDSKEIFEESVKEQIANAKPIKIKKGDNLYQILKCAGIPIKQINKSIQALRGIFNPKHLNTNHELLLTITEETKKPNLLSLIIRISLKSEIVIEQSVDGSFVATCRKRNVLIKTKSFSGIITKNLYKDAINLGVTDKAIKTIINAFGYVINFERNLHQGDVFEVMYDILVDQETGEENFLHVSYMALKIRSKTIELFRYQTKNGSVDYYEKNGMTVQRNLLKRPVDGAYISSGFGWRKTPVSKNKTFHKGIDFAAPKNTIVRSAGKGLVYKIYRSASYGNVVIIEHGSDGSGSKYHTLYAHLNSFAPGLRKNSLVMQGDPIGRVGCTGTARGYHLHFEVWRNMKKVDPMKVKGIPVGKSLKGHENDHFLSQIKYLKHKFNNTLDENKI